MLVEDERLALLERFPLDESELDQLLVLCEAYYQRRGGGGGDNNKNKNQKELLSSLTALFSATMENEQQFDVIAALEETLLPELASIFQRELQQTTFVVGVAETDVHYNQARFLETVVTLMGRRGALRDDKLFTILVDPDEQAEKNGHSAVSVNDLASFLHRLAIAVYHLEQQQQQQSGAEGTRVELLASTLVQPSSSSLTNCWATSMRSTAGANHKSEMISRLQWLDWVQTTAPEAPRLLALVFQHVFGAVPSATVSTSFSAAPTFRRLSPFEWVASPRMAPEISAGKSNNTNSAVKSYFWEDSTQAIPLQLSLMGLGGPWLQSSRRLYSSEHNGLAFETFSLALLSFAGPTLILIRTTKGATMGYYSELQWKSGPRWHSAENDSGDDVSGESAGSNSRSSFLFRMQPSWTVYRWAGDADTSSCADSPWSYSVKKSRYHQYLHSPVSYRKGMLAGLAVGGVADDAPRLHLTTTLENCKAGLMDSTFQPGPLLENDDTMFFDVDALEVWAIRSDHFRESLLEGQLHASVREAARHHLAQVDRRQFVEDFQSGAYMNRVYGHRHLTRGSGSFTPDEDETKEHYLQSCPTSPTSLKN